MHSNLPWGAVLFLRRSKTTEDHYDGGVLYGASTILSHIFSLPFIVSSTTSGYSFAVTWLLGGCSRGFVFISSSHTEKSSATTKSAPYSWKLFLRFTMLSWDARSAPIKFCFIPGSIVLSQASSWSRDLNVGVDQFLVITAHRGKFKKHKHWR